MQYYKWIALLDVLHVCLIHINKNKQYMYRTSNLKCPCSPFLYLIVSTIISLILPIPSAIDILTALNQRNQLRKAVYFLIKI